MREKSYTFLLLALLLLFNFQYLYSLNKEVAKSVASLLVLQQIDSTLYFKYNNAKKLFSENKNPEALKLTLTLLEDIKKVNDHKLHFYTNYLLAKIWYKSKSYEKAIFYFKRSKNYFPVNRTKNTEFTKEVFLNGDFLELENYFKIGTSYHRLLEDYDSIAKYKDSALFYYAKVVNKSSLNKNVLKLQSKTFNNLSTIYMHDSLFSKSEDYARKSIKIANNIGDKFDKAASYGNLASIYLFKNDFELSKTNSIKALDILRNEDTDQANRYKADLYFNLAYAMYMLKDYKAYEYQERSYNLTDDFRDKELRTIIEKINAENNFGLGKQLGIKEEENKRLKDQRTFWFFGIGSLVIIISLLYWVNFYKLKKNNLGLKLSQTQLIQNQKIEKIRSDSQIRILNATIDGKESERKQIAETLHDSVSALLSSANLHLQATRNHFNGKTPIEIDKTQEIITEASQKIRDLSHTLVSSVLLKFGLKFAINDIAEKYSNSQIEFKTDIGDIKRYHQNFEIKAYNIIQEFINNILKHSKAENATIALKEKNKRLYLKITDDGIGFDKTQVTVKDGLGINQIDARIQVMKGYFFIDSSENKGTIIDVELPILEKEEINLV